MVSSTNIPAKPLTNPSPKSPQAAEAPDIPRRAKIPRPAAYLCVAPSAGASPRWRPRRPPPGSTEEEVPVWGKNRLGKLLDLNIYYIVEILQNNYRSMNQLSQKMWRSQNCWNGKFRCFCLFCCKPMVYYDVQIHRYGVLSWMMEWWHISLWSRG